MRNLRLLGPLAILILASSSAFAVTYPGGSLIIPMQSAYQDYCGIASAYGLVYKVLQANDWLSTNGMSRITVHWAYKATKGSPNRCVPTNRNVPPVYGSYTTANPPPWNDPVWNDGCDFRLTDTTSPAVKLISNLSGASASDTIITTINTVGDATVYPNYPAVTIAITPVLKSVTSVGYMGGPFIINASDAPIFLQLLTGTLVANDASGAAIDFGPYRTPATCSFGSATSGHHVNIHRAQTSFNGDDNTNFNAPPPRVALLETDSLDGYVTGGILPQYLASAGLSFPGAFGCPVGSVNASNTTLCPSGATSGVIFDYLDVQDLANGALSNLDTSGKPIYKAVWTPHWEFGTSAGENTAMQNISTFLNQQNGLFAECASIASYEGSTSGTPTVATNGTQFETCVQDTANPGQCAATITTTGTSVNISSSGVVVPNCTNPTLSNGARCVYFASPGDSFAQIGDYQWNDKSGLVANYMPNTGSIYKSGTLPIISNVTSLNKTKLSTPAAARAMVVSDESTRNVKDNRPGRANILYLGGHTYSDVVSGTRIVLGTLLQLGLVYATAETGYQGATLYNGTAFIPTYDRVTSTPTASTVKKYNFGVGSQWIFPYHSGHLRTHPLSGSGSQLAAGDNSFTSAVQWDAKTSMPAPGQRNLFTYLGASLVTSSNVAQQTGWTPIDIDYTNIQSPVTTCVDELHVGQVLADPTTGRPGPYTGMLPGANGVCDLEEALAANLSLNAGDFGSDQGASEQAAIKSKLLDTSVGGAVQAIRQFTQMVRGFCFATSTGNDGSGTMIVNPATTDCNYRAQPDINYLGGIVHSQVAVIPASSLVGDAPVGKHRPTVAYAGALDGQLHAFYVPSDGNDNGYSGPSTAVNDSFASARGTFHNDWLGTGSFSPPSPLTELWSFIPPGQLGFLHSNDATVDSSPVVIDVFGDFNNSGVRSWHTVLVASSGDTNRELFALDVTNPLAPVFLWQVQSSYDSTSLPYAPVVLMDNDLGKDLIPGESAFQWQNRCRAADVTAGTCTAAKFALPPAADNGRSTSGWFNYQHLGASSSLSAAMLRRNNVPVFAAFVATNEPGGQGMYLFAVDLTNGRKIWEFNNPYDKASDPVGMADGIDNTPPPGVTLFSKFGTSLVDTVYAGDLEGSLWELDAADGLSLTSYANQIGASCTAAGSCSFALSNAYGYDPSSNPQPITTLSTIFTVPGSLPATSPLTNYKGQTLLAYGTAGTDKVSGLSYTVTGSLHLLPLGPTGRYSASDVINTTGLFATVSSKGVAKELSGYPLYVTPGERLYGSITAVGDHLFFATTSGAVANIDSRGALSGSTYSLNLASAASSALSSLAFASGGAGGAVLVDKSVPGQARIVTVTDQHINVSALVPTNVNGPSINGLGQTPTSLLGWFFRSSGREY